MEKILSCKNCLMPSSRPRVSFNKDQICNGCLHQFEKRKINWDDRKKEFKDICDKFRSKNNEYDCIVPWSGGKDSSYIAHRLKFEFNMNPLLVTFSPLIPTEIGFINRLKLINQGFDNIFFTPNQKISRYLSKRFFIERGNPKTHWDAGINSLPVKIAMEKNINLIFYAEHGESEYGGKVLSKESCRSRNLEEVLENQIGDHPSNWVDQYVNQKDIECYIYPDENQLNKKKINAFYFSYFFYWDVYENYKYVKEKFGFKNNLKRISGTFQDYDSMDDKIDPLYYYMQLVKFGFGRSLRDASRLLKNGHISLDKAKKYIKKYDDEFPDENLIDVLEYLNIEKNELSEIIDHHRNKEIWIKKNNNFELTFEK